MRMTVTDQILSQIIKLCMGRGSSNLKLDLQAISALWVFPVNPADLFTLSLLRVQGYCSPRQDKEQFQLQLGREAGPEL